MNALRRLAVFARESWIEVRTKVTWPGRPEVQGTTVVVLITTLIFAAYLGVVDAVLALVVKRVFDLLAPGGGVS